VLQTLSTAYAERGLRVISVAVDPDAAAAQRTLQLLRDSGVTFPVVDDHDHRIARQYWARRCGCPRCSSWTGREGSDGEEGLRRRPRHVPARAGSGRG